MNLSAVWWPWKQKSEWMNVECLCASAGSLDCFVIGILLESTVCRTLIHLPKLDIWTNIQKIAKTEPGNIILINIAKFDSSFLYSSTKQLHSNTLIVRQQPGAVAALLTLSQPDIPRQDGVPVRKQAWYDGVESWVSSQSVRVGPRQGVSCGKFVPLWLALCGVQAIRVVVCCRYSCCLPR